MRFAFLAGRPSAVRDFALFGIQRSSEIQRRVFWLRRSRAKFSNSATCCWFGDGGRAARATVRLPPGLTAAPSTSGEGEDYPAKPARQILTN